MPTRRGAGTCHTTHDGHHARSHPSLDEFFRSEHRSFDGRLAAEKYFEPEKHWQAQSDSVSPSQHVFFRLR